MTIKVAGGIGTKVVCAWIAGNSPAANSTQDNIWDFAEIVDLEDGAAYDGDVGIQISSAQARLFEVNINALDWLAVFVTTRTAGNVMCKVTLANDN